MLNGNESLNGKSLSLERCPAHDSFLDSYRKWCSSDPFPFEDVFHKILWEKVYPGLRPDSILDIADAYRMLESPIEVSMFFALALVGLQDERSVQYVHNGVARGNFPGAGPLLHIEPQASVGEYRVDFLITLAEQVPDFEHMIGESPGFKVVESKIVVECDGFDFHERTKEQASKDHARDRTLQSMGYQVFRYTGADIWKDVFACAEEVVSRLNDGNCQQT